MRILVVGAGAVGGYFGGRLLEAGRKVTFLVRPRRAALLAKNGLRIRSAFGDYHRDTPPTITADALTQPFDLVLLSCKAYDLEDAIKRGRGIVLRTNQRMPPGRTGWRSGCLMKEVIG